MTKKKAPEDLLKVGRHKWEPDAAQLKILEDSFKLGCTVKQALAQSKIPSSTFYDYLAANPEFSEQIEWWQEYPNILAKHSVVAQMAKDGRLALDYLSRRCKNEFGIRTEVTGADGEPVTVKNEIDIEKIKKLNEMFND